MLMLSLIRQGMRGLAGIMPGPVSRVIGSNVTVALVTLVLFVIVIKRNSLNPLYPVARHRRRRSCSSAACCVVALRFGLFALIVAFLVLNFAGDAPLTLDAAQALRGSGVVLHGRHRSRSASSASGWRAPDSRCWVENEAAPGPAQAERLRPRDVRLGISPASSLRALSLSLPISSAAR